MSDHKEQSLRYKDPDTPINYPKEAKKSFISWLIPALCFAILMGLVVIAQSWADDRYTKKADTLLMQNATNKALDEEQRKRETLEISQQDVNRKLDLIIYILQHEGKLTSQEMKGKLSPP